MFTCHSGGVALGILEPRKREKHFLLLLRRDRLKRRPSALERLSSALCRRLALKGINRET